MTEQTELESPSTTVGQQLHKARQLKQLSVPNIAQQLCLKEHIIYALENDEALTNIAPTFVKGYIRAYAKILGLDGEKLVAEYNAQHLDDKQYNAPMISFSRKVARESIDSRWMLVTYGVVAVLVLMIIIWWYQQTQTNSLVVAPPPAVETQAEESQEAEPQEAEPQVVEPQIVDSTPTEEPTIVTTAQEGGEAAVDAAMPETATDETTTDEATLLSSSELTVSAPEVPRSDITEVLAALENADPDLDEPLLADVSNESRVSTENETIELVFTFAEECWVKVTDATGNDIAYGVKDAGRVMPVSGVPPFAVVLGAPAGVAISYDGTPIDLSDFPYNRTARFNLPLEAQ